MQICRGRVFCRVVTAGVDNFDGWSRFGYWYIEQHLRYCGVEVFTFAVEAGCGGELFETEKNVSKVLQMAKGIIVGGNFALISDRLW